MPSLRNNECITLTWFTVGVAAIASHTYAQGATRHLPIGYVGGVSHTVSIDLNTKGESTTAGIEDMPPTGWAVFNISNGGVWDASNDKVKWGPFFAPSIPAAVTYDVTPPSDENGERCFSGTISLDGINEPVIGDDCLDPDNCTPDCAGRVCGGDECGGSCGFLTTGGCLRLNAEDCATGGGRYGGEDSSCFGDSDSDGHFGCDDNCPNIVNVSQEDFDEDGFGDACDSDIDNDGVPNPSDDCDFTPTERTVNSAGTLRGDLDGDCKVDLLDFRIFQNDFTGSGEEP